MVNLLIAGDFCPNDRVARLIEQEEYSDILGEIKPIIAQMDYSLINLECPIVECPIKPMVASTLFAGSDDKTAIVFQKSA